MNFTFSEFTKKCNSERISMAVWTAIMMKICFVVVPYGRSLQTAGAPNTLTSRNQKDKHGENRVNRDNSQAWKTPSGFVTSVYSVFSVCKIFAFLHTFYLLETK